MDTVGAWLIYREVRDRGAKVVGASKQVSGLLDQVAEADKPAKVVPDKRGGITGVVEELGEWVAEAGQAFVGLIGFLGAASNAASNVLAIHP